MNRERYFFWWLREGWCVTLSLYSSQVHSMKYFEHKVLSNNSLIIKSFYWLECDEIKHFQFFLPDGYPELMATNFPISVSSDSKSVIEHSTCLFWGQIRFSGHITSTQPYKMFGIKFQPWVLRLIQKSNNSTLTRPCRLWSSCFFIRIYEIYQPPLKCEQLY